MKKTFEICPDGCAGPALQAAVRCVQHTVLLSRTTAEQLIVRVTTCDSCTRMVYIAARQSRRAVRAELRRPLFDELTRLNNPDSIVTADQFKH